MRRTTHSGEVNFVTLTVVDWLDVFTRKTYKDFLVQCLQHCQKSKGLEIFAYVIMTNHLHLVVRDTSAPLSDVLRDFKTYTSKELVKMIGQDPQESREEWMLPIFYERGQANPLNTHHKFWKNENYQVALPTNEMLLQKVNYIHENPVRAGFVNEPHEWYYSSAHLLSPVRVMTA